MSGSPFQHGFVHDGVDATLSMTGIKPLARRKELVEEQPMMRSVGIVRPVGHGPIGIPPLKFGGLPSKSSATKPFVPVDIAKGVADFKLPLRNHRDRKVTPSNWRIVASNLQPVPVDYPVERTSRLIADTDVAVIAARICDCLRLRSVEAKFDNENASAKCRTADNLSFKIKLYSSDDGVLVEIQRRKGSSVVFSRECRAILKAAEGDGAQVSNSPLFPKCSVPEMAFLQEAKIEETDSDAVDALKSSEMLLLSSKDDVKLLALENIAFLTNKEKSSVKTAMDVSNLILQNGSVVRDFVTTLILASSAKARDDIEIDFSTMMRGQALTILFNVLSLKSTSDELSTTVQNEEQLFVDTLVPNLVSILRSGKDNTSDACQASKCLSLIFAVSLAARERASRDGISAILSEMVDFGSRYHSNLAKEAANSASVLECSC